MRLRLLLPVLLLGASALGDPMRAAGCDPDGPVRFICGITAPEDLVAVPQSDWVLASGYRGGGLHLVSTRDHTITQVFPTTPPRVRHDTKTYAACPGPIDPAEREKMSAHGLNIRPAANRVHTVYMVHHGFRESIEVFEIDTKATPPSLRWVGCVVVPGMQGLNSVSPLPDGGFVTTNFAPRNDQSVMANLQKGGNSGEVWEWNPKDGWKMVPGSESPGPNGIEASKDGRWLYVNLWPVRKVMRLSRGQTQGPKQFVDVPFQPDNIRWQADGSLLAAGHAAPTLQRLLECFSKICADATSNVARIDPESLKAQEIVRYPAKAVFSGATAALQVGKEIWLGAVRGDRIARYPIQ
jgi:hypothetical protein